MPLRLSLFMLSNSCVRMKLHEVGYPLWEGTADTHYNVMIGDSQCHFQMVTEDMYY